MTPKPVPTNADFPRRRIVVLEDEMVAREFFCRALESKFEVQAFANLEDGLDAISSADLVVSDWEMPGAGGEGLLRMLEQMDNPPPVVIVSGLSLFDQRLKEVRDKNLPFIPKPLGLNHLIATVALNLPARS